MENVLADRGLMRLRRPARLLRLASDERLVALVRAGDEGAFEALYDRHHPAILGFCRHMLGTREEAEDAVQHTFLAAFRDLARHDKPVELRPWLFAIARNRCLSLLRARKAHVAIELAEPTTDGLAATVERREDLRELLTDLGHLPEDQRAALLLAELGALDHAGIATVLGCSREKVKALVFQARSSLAASREARATPCEEIRLELATASGAALRRGPLRRHLRACAGCRAFKTEVATQRKLLALALPVVPTVALKASVLSGGGAAAATSAASAGATAGASGGTLGGVLGMLASSGAGKVAVSLAVAGALAGGGTLTEQLARRDAGGTPAPGAARAADPAGRTGSLMRVQALGTPAVEGHASPPTGLGRAGTPGGDTSAPVHPVSARPAPSPGDGSAVSVEPPAHAAPPTPVVGRRPDGGAVQPGDVGPPASPPPAQGQAPGTPPVTRPPQDGGRAPDGPPGAVGRPQPAPGSQGGDSRGRTPDSGVGKQDAADADGARTGAPADEAPGRPDGSPGRSGAAQPHNG